MHTDIEKTIGEWENIKSDFYSNGSSNNDLESEFYEDS